MRISEIFHSIQGEGTLLGVPSVFVRTSGCNLRCTWCDTPYTSWRPEGAELTVPQVLDHVLKFGSSHVVVTGGEPLISPDTPELTASLRNAGLHITIETAGTVAPSVCCDLMSISPKLSNSTPLERDGGRWAKRHDRLRYRPEILKQLVSRFPYQLKFVVCSPTDLDEVKHIQTAVDAPASKVLLMPEGTNREAIVEKSRWLVEICKANGYRFSPRLHVDLWGAMHGV